MNLQWKTDVVQHVPLHQKIEALENHADAAPKVPELFSGQVPEFLPLDRHRSLRRNFQIIQTADQCTLAGA